MQSTLAPQGLAQISRDSHGAPYISISNKWRELASPSQLLTQVNEVLREEFPLPSLTPEGPRPDSSTAQGRRELLARLRTRRLALQSLLKSLPSPSELQEPAFRSSNGRVSVVLICGRPVLDIDPDWAARTPAQSLSEAVNECVAYAHEQREASA